MTLLLYQVFEQARSLEMAYKNPETCNQLYPSNAEAVKRNSDKQNEQQLNAINNKVKCFFWRLNKHPHNSCPVKDSAMIVLTCNNCGKIEHA